MDNRNMIPQHEPLRIPVKWDANERAFVLQIERILEDIYRNLSLLKRKIDSLEQQINGGE